MEYLYAKEYQTLGPKCYAFKLIGRQISGRGEAAIDLEDRTDQHIMQPATYMAA